MGYQLLLNVNKKKGFLSMVPCVLVFTGESILFAHIDKTMQKQIMNDKKEQMKAEGKGFLKQSVGMMKAMGEFINLYHQKSEDEILSENSMNFKLDNNKIDRIIFKPVKIMYDAENQSSQTGGKLLIKANGEKIKAIHSIYDNNKAIKKYLKDVYGKAAR
ncbi:MAG: hypothetical protein JXQ23_03555 [Clostridia bacterium]|nr:hypothetical protein [Clostridia bacterium]